MNLKAVILAGGRGTRFWPLSRRSRPKQFLNISGRRTMLQETIARLEPLIRPEDVFIACGEEYRDQVLEQVPGLPSGNLILEPEGKNTAPCIGLAAARLHERFGDVSMVVLPADHVIGRHETFRSAVAAAAELAQQGWLVTFGIHPSHAATGYGYLGRGESLGRFSGWEAFRVTEFVEKPDSARARELVDGSSHDWNSGMFVWKTSVILDHIQRLLPELGRLLAEMSGRWDQQTLLSEGFSSLPAVSIDHGVMERAERVAVLPCDLQWSDVGNWRALGTLLPGDDAGNAGSGPVVQIDSKGCVIQAGDKMVALLGVENLIVVDTPDALLVCDLDRAEEIKALVQRLQAEGREDLL